MRYELYLQRLPRLDPEALTDHVADLPKGLSVGAVEKALREKQLPAMAVAWSDDREAVDAIAQRLTRHGAQCVLRDRAPLLVKAASIFSGGKKKERAKPAIRFRKRTRRPKRDVTGELMQRLLPNSPAAARVLRAVCLGIGGFVARWVVIGGLYAAYLVAVEGQSASPEALRLPLAAVGTGVFCAQLLTSSAAAMVAGQLHVALAVPPIVASIASLVFALQQHEVRVSTRELRPTLAEEQAAVEAAAQPPAKIRPMPRYPFEGLMEELRIRKMKGEIPELTAVEVQPTAGELEHLPGAKMANVVAAEATTSDLAPAAESPLEGEAGAAVPAAQPPSQQSEAAATEPHDEGEPAAPRHETPGRPGEAVTGDEPWPQYFGLSQPASLALLGGSWALALALAVALWWAMRRNRNHAAAPASAETTPSPESETAQPGPDAELDPDALERAHAAADALRADLEREAQARKQAESKLTAIEALSAGRVAELGEQLEATRAELEAAKTQLELLSSAVASPPPTPPSAAAASPANANANANAPAPERQGAPRPAAAPPSEGAAVGKMAPRPAPRRGTYTLADVDEERIHVRKGRD